MFGDIMLLESPRPPPVDPDDVNEKYSTDLFLIYMRVDNPLRYWNISISNGPIVFKLYTEVKYLKLHCKLSMTRLTPKLHSRRHFCIPQFFEMQYLHE